MTTPPPVAQPETDAPPTADAVEPTEPPRTRAEARARREAAEGRSRRASPAPAAAGATAKGPRIEWMDAARAASVLAVVAFHVGYINFLPLVHDHPNVATKAWIKLGDLLSLARMPMLLTVSGILAATKIRSGLSPRTVVGAVSNYYLYLVWLLVYAVTVSPGVTELSVHGPVNLAQQTLLPETTVWFVWLLAVGVAVLAALRRVPKAAVIGALIVFGMIVAVRDPKQTPLWLDVAPLTIYLAFGAYFAGWLKEHVAELRTLGIAVAALVVLVPAYLVLPVAPWAKYPVRVLAGLACAVTLLAVAQRLCRIPVLARLGSWVGQRTLPIYVMHFPMLAGLGLLPLGVREGLGRALSGNVVLALFYPALLVLTLAVICLALEQLMQRVGLGFMFTMPKSWRDAVSARLAAPEDRD